MPNIGTNSFESIESLFRHLFGVSLGSPLLYFLALFALAGLVFLKGASSPRGEIWGVYRRGRFMTANEKCFLPVLEDALGANYRVFAQVRLAEIVDVTARVGGARRQAALNKVFGKSVDFVICSAGTLDPVAVLEVDDRTHLRFDRQRRDAFVNAVFAEIGLPLVRVGARMEYSVWGLRKTLALAGVGEEWEPAGFGRAVLERGN